MFAARYAKPDAKLASAARTPLAAISPASWEGLRQSKVNAMGMRGTCVVRLIDRRTGLTHKVGGSPLVIFTRDPALAATELLEGRDRSIWEVRVDPIES